MKDRFFGTFKQSESKANIDVHIEEISLRGYTIVENIYTASQLSLWRSGIDAVYSVQEKEFGKESLIAICDSDTCRAPLLYDRSFIDMASHPKILSIIDRILGSWCILNLQNAIISRPGIEHQQRAWHRDLPHQNHVSSNPWAISVLIAIDEFSTETGATELVPFTHKSEIIPSDIYILRNKITAEASAGSAILFDSMTFHRAGKNISNVVRRAVNHMYTLPIIKQQYDFARVFSAESGLDSATSRLLGVTSAVAEHDRSWRQMRLTRLSK